MNSLSRLTGRLACALGGVLVATAPAWADGYPTKPVRIVVPFAAGGAIDVIVRAVAPQLGKELGQSIVVENRPGAGGNIGSEIVAKSAPDGYTLLAGTSATHGANAGLFAKLPYDPRKDFVPIAHLAGVPNVLVVTPASGIKSVDDLADKNVAVQSGSNGPAILEELAPKASQQEFKTDEEARALLKAFNFPFRQ